MIGVVMPEESTPGPLGTAMREVTFPDGSRGIILVRAGTPQAEAEQLAAQVWRDTPDK
ncbi:hypothetical protein [Streptomyces sp. MMG1533]|uniref:hypothetical protein n=1 Tax=Streptomyces sp. MMG1533 TaxID=1415546 RepID=UPI000A425C25|nr:hypothetical protein [Streptomyces sp. MMG1533]